MTTFLSRALLAGLLLSGPVTVAQTLLFAGGKSFRVHESPSVAVSADEGKTWTLAFEGARKGMDNPSFVTDLAYGGGKLVAVTNYGVVLTSADRGKTWTPQSVKEQLKLNGGFNGVAYGGGMFLAAGSDDALAYSADGVSWQRLGALPGSQAETASRAADDAKLTARRKLGGLAGKLGGAVGSSLGNAAATKTGPVSTDPGVHLGVTDPKDEIKYTHTYGVDFIDGKFYLTGNFGRIAVFVPRNGKPVREAVSHVNDKLTNALRATASDGKGHLVAFMEDGMNNAYSADGGQTWEENFDVKQRLLGGNYGAGKFVAVSAFGDVATSPTGASWEVTNIARMNDGGSFADAIYTGKNWVIVGNGDCSWMSADGKKWTRTDTKQLYLKKLLVVK